MTGPASVVLAGPSQLLLIGVRHVLEAEDRFEVVDQTHLIESALGLARRLCPDFVVLDGTARSHESSGEGFAGTVRGLARLSRPPAVLVIVDPDQFPLVEELRQAGCRVCVSTGSAEDVVGALDMLSVGREFFPDWGKARRRENTRGASRPSGLLEKLNRSEIRILRLMALGWSSKEIAPRVGLAVSTVNNYRSRIKARLGVRTRAEIRRAARKAGLLAPHDDPDR